MISLATAKPITDQDCLEHFSIVFWCPDCRARLGTPCASNEPHTPRVDLARTWLNTEGARWCSSPRQR